MDFREWLADDYYNLLGVNQLSTKEEINRAYRKQAKNYHPDTYPINSVERFQAEQKFKKLLQARDTLTDHNKRQSYDEERQVWQDFYLASMSNAYNFQLNKKKEVNKMNNINNERLHHEITNDLSEAKDSHKKDKRSFYRNQGAKRYYSMCLRAIGYGDYQRAWIYFQSAKYLKPELKMPPALWNLASQAKYNV